MRAKLVLSFVLLGYVLTTLIGWSQAASDSPFLVRMERQTREENVCMLVQQNGRYHLERIITGRPRVFEGTLDSSAVSELQPLLNSDQLTNLKQAQIETSLASEDMDQVLIAIARPYGWQSLNFPSGKSRKPYKAVMDPLVRWLDRNKQQQNPIVGAPTVRCMPPQTAQAGGDSKPNASNPYVMRIVVDHNAHHVGIGCVGLGISAGLGGLRRHAAHSGSAHNRILLLLVAVEPPDQRIHDRLVRFSALAAREVETLPAIGACDGD